MGGDVRELVVSAVRVRLSWNQTVKKARKMERAKGRRRICVVSA